MRDCHSPLIMASERVQMTISATNKTAGERRNDEMNSPATSKMGMQSHLLSPSR